MRWISRGLTAVVAVIVLLLAVVYGGSEWMIRKGRTVPMAQVVVPTDAASIAEGGRLARIASCRDCHGANGEGKVLFDVPPVGRVSPPALARVAANMSDAELVRAIRQGVHKDGSTLFIMPSHALSNLSDEDVGKIVAWVRTLKPGAKDSTATTTYGPVGRTLMLAGKLPPQAVGEQRGPAKRPADMGPYVVSFACQACHKLHEESMMEDGSTKVPALAPVAAAYDPARFKKLLRTGVGTKPDHGIMSVVARESFSVLTDGEIDSIQTYLRGEVFEVPAR